MPKQYITKDMLEGEIAALRDDAAMYQQRILLLEKELSIMQKYAISPDVLRTIEMIGRSGGQVISAMQEIINRLPAVRPDAPASSYSAGARDDQAHR